MSENIYMPVGDKSVNDIVLKFDGDTHQINANTLINSLLHFSSIVQEANKELNTGRKIDVKIQAIEKGSFLIHLVLESTLMDNLKNLFTKDNLEIAGNIATVVGGVYAVAKVLKGKEAVDVSEKNSNVTIENVEGDKIVVNIESLNLYEKPQIKEALAQEFKTLGDDETVTGFEIIDPTSDKSIVKINQSEFDNLSNLNKQIQYENRKLIKEGMLNIYKVVFDDFSKWEFYYDGNKMSAKISDIKFIERVENGERFAKGDSFKAEIEIKQIFEPSVNAYINKGYRIIKILEHIPRPEQGGLYRN